MSSENVLETVELTKCYRTYSDPRQRLMEMLFRERSRSVEPHCALRGVSLALAPGEILGVIGPNGSGKSTLLQLIAGTLRPTSGSLQVRGRLTALLELGAGVDPQMTGRENIMLMGQTYGLDRETVLERMDAIIEFSELESSIDNPMKTYSSGMFVRLAFAVSTALDPDLLIVDEALSVGDVGFQLKCLDRLESLIGGGASILLASHDLQLIKNYCTRAICLHQGEVIEQSDPESVTERYLQLMHDRNRRSDAPVMQWHRDDSGSVRLFSGGGRIEHACIQGTRGHHVLDSGEIATIDVSGRLDEGAERLRNPTVVVVLRDVRGYNLYGLSANVEGGLAILGNEFRVRFEIPVALASGHYTVTVRLEDRRSSTVFRLVDKKVGVCAFQVDASRSRPFWGTVDLKGRVVDPPGPPASADEGAERHRCDPEFSGLPLEGSSGR